MLPDCDLPRVIGLAGFKRSGKDTVGRMLCEVLGYSAMAFADPVRDEVFERFHVARMPDHLKDVPMRHLGGRSYRDLLIEVGQGRRAENPDHWVSKAREKIAARLASGQRVVLTDIRMPNEVRLIHVHGGIAAWISRRGVESNGHVTEQDHRHLCDLVIENDGTKEDLLRRVVDGIKRASLGCSGKSNHIKKEGAECTCC